MRDNPLRAALQRGECVFGVMAQEFATDGFPAITAAAGAEFIVYDLEHTGWSLETLKRMVAAGRAAAAVPLVRVPVNDYHHVAHSLDCGVCGAVLPMVNSPEELTAALDAAYYPPLGRRGCSFGLGHDSYASPDLPAMMRHANENLLVVAQIESRQGVEHAEAICGEPRVHAIWIGHYDLSCSLGAPGDFTTDEYRTAVDRVMDACRRHRKAAVLGAGDPAALAAGIEKGYRMLVATSDIQIYARGVRDAAAAVRSAAGPRAQP